MPATSKPAQSADSIDVDLTKISSTMVYSEVYNMMVSPDNYTEKPLKQTVLLRITKTRKQRSNTLPVSLPMRRLAAHRDLNLF